MSDPSGFVTNPPSTYVKIGNTARQDMNGKFGLVVGFSNDRARYVLLLCQNGQQAMLKPENLSKASAIEKYQAQYQQITNDPNVKRQIITYYNKAQQMLGGVKPEYAAAAVGIGLLLMIYMIGFTKIMMLMSMIMLLGIIIGPDIMTTSRSAVNWKVVALNFPRRCKETIEQTVPAARGRVTDKMAAGIVVAMMLIVGKTLFTSPPSSPRIPPQAVPPATATVIQSSSSSSSIEQAYKMGFDDASADKPFASSSLQHLKTTIPSAPVNDIDYDYIPTAPPPKTGGGFGIGTAMSLVMIGRTVMQLGAPAGGGGFDVQLAMANLQTLPMYQQGLLAFSIFNVLRAFF